MLYNLIIIISLAAYLVTEVLSLFFLLNRVTLGAFWIAVVISILLLIRILYGSFRAFIEGTGSLIRGLISQIKRDPLLMIIYTVAAFSLILACVTTPYNHDSMTYHLARVAHWEQNHSIGHYATNVIRQASSPVFAEKLSLNI